MNGKNKRLKKIFSWIILFLGVVLPSVAQKKTYRSVRPMSQTDKDGQKLFKSMLPATAKVMFIDSVVVSKANFLKHVPIGHEAGALSLREALKRGEGELCAQYENEFGDRRVLADGDSITSKLYSQILLGKGWDIPQPLPGIDFGEYEQANYPFLASDGVTLYFAAKGPHSMGGYDIFMTTYDNDKAQWYEPQNYGLPFNSTANDYLLAVNDIDTLGWLVTDRYQSKDSVCIYTFVPTYPRKDFQEDGLDEARLTRYAEISSIRDTWKFGDRKAAMNRLAALKARCKVTEKEDGMRFAINDRKIVTSISQFKKAESKRLYAQLQELDKLAEQTAHSISGLRAKYATVPASRNTLGEEILKMEKELDQQQKDRKNLAKRIRNLENQ